MTIDQLFLVVGIILLGHELNPAPRLLLGASIGLWGAFLAFF